MHKLGDSSKKKLDCESRKALKSIFNISHHSKNFLQKLFHINSITHTIHRNKMNLFNRLLRNKITKSLILRMIHTPNGNNFVNNLVCYGVDIIDRVLSGKINEVPEQNELTDDVRIILQTCIDNWEVAESRQI